MADEQKIKKFLFDGYNQNNPEDEWQDMPEFIQEEQEAYQKIIVRFRNEKDVEDFGKLISLNITPNTTNLWFPNTEIGSYVDKEYVVEGNENES